MKALIPLCGAVLAFGALPLSSPLSSQEPQSFTFDRARVDAYAPLGVVDAHTLPADRIELTYSFVNEDLEGLRLGDFPVFADEVFEIFMFAPMTQSRMTHRLSVAWALNDDVTLSASAPWVQKDMGHLTVDGLAFFTEASGLGDVSVSGLYDIYESGPVRALVSGAVSIPTGSIEERDATPIGSASQLPYPMQIGSGTFDVSPGATVVVMNEHGVVGAQIASTMRLGENDRGYRLGDRLSLSAWLSPRINEFISLSARVLYETWDSVDGFDPDMNVDAVPLAVARFQGGTRVDIPFGVNFLFADGRLAGHRLAIEAGLPAHQDYDGIQLDRNWTVTVGWRTAF